MIAPIARPPLTIASVVAPIVVAGTFVDLVGRLREPTRQQFSALMIAGAGAVYFGAGFGWWEVAFCALLTWLAYRGLREYRYVAVAWMLHVVWDILHHLYGRPILPFVPLSSAGCAICDTGIAIWYWLRAPRLGWRSIMTLRARSSAG